MPERVLHYRRVRRKRTAVIAERHHLTGVGDDVGFVGGYAEHGVVLARANDDRRAGYSRILELLRQDNGRPAPAWTRLPTHATGAPRLYVFSTCINLIEQMQSAPVAADGPGAGLMIDPNWTTSHGHAVDSLRYLSMARSAVTCAAGVGTGD
jgi:hypothetical protein